MDLASFPDEPPLKDDYIAHALTLPEGEWLDFKRLGKNETALKTLAAMSNTVGGFLFLGVEDSKKAMGRDRLIGIDENPEALDALIRDCETRITPAFSDEVADVPLNWNIISGTDSNGKRVRIAVIQVQQSNAVHTIVGGGTYVRRLSSNYQLAAGEITKLSLRRGVSSAVDVPIDLPEELLDTQTWRDYANVRSLTRPLGEQLCHIGLSKKNEQGYWYPTIAAALLFAEEPQGVIGRKCAIRLFHYRGHDIEYSANTNLVKSAITISGPLVDQIRKATDAVMNELASGVQVSSSGFETRQLYPKRVVQEAITNAVIHRDYRLNRDIQIRIFANRIEVESPGVFPGNIGLDTIRKTASKPRNRSLVDHLRDFPVPPNLDAGEGVRMMFATTREQHLMPPVYELLDNDQKEGVLLKLFNEARMSEWEQTEAYLDEHSTVSNRELRNILNVDQVKSSRMLRGWVDQGLLVIDNPDEGTRNRRYRMAGEHRDLEMDALFDLLFSSDKEEK